ncbi:MAG: hypothetical protein D6770_03950 [Anaerolineae bacterium]|nr:MAG: hypothetical protein D6770_03950 [Anaerolineae bacterium]
MDSMENRKITIIEGPPPIFEPVQDAWVLSLTECSQNKGSHPWIPAVTRLRTFNGPALVERCYRAWRDGETIRLHFRDAMGLEQSVPILAARSVDTEEGQVLLLWVRVDPAEIEMAFDSDEGAEDDFDL